MSGKSEDAAEETKSEDGAEEVRSEDATEEGTFEAAAFGEDASGLLKTWTQSSSRNIHKI